MLRRRTLTMFGAAAATLVSVALVSPARAQFTENALGKVTASGNKVVIHSGSIAGPRWFGVRVFTVPAGTMTKHNVLKTRKANLSYPGKPNTGKSVLCISDFQGTGSPTGGMFGPASAVAAGGDPLISMVGGFAGKKTGCTDGRTGDMIFEMNTTGPITTAFYGTFFGDSPAGWRTQVGDMTGNTAWWNLWGNFTELGFGSTG